VVNTREHIFTDRSAAGVELARLVAERNLRPPILVLGLPRGGVPVAYEVARALRAPLDVMVVRKIGMPGQPEFAIGAIASGNIVVTPSGSTSDWMWRDSAFEELVRGERVELEHRERVYRSGLPRLRLDKQTVVLVDDGLATGYTMLAAVRAARKAGAAIVICAVPVGSDEAVSLIAAEADDVLILQTSHSFFGISEWYEHFDQLEDAEVERLLAAAQLEVPAHQDTFTAKR
jgi:putative phosphoribosyl transferase